VHGTSYSENGPFVLEISIHDTLEVLSIKSSSIISTVKLNIDIS